MSFFSKVNSGSPPAVIIWEIICDIDNPVWVKSGGSGADTCSSTFLVQPSMSSLAGWTEYNVDYRPNPKAKTAGVVFAFLDSIGNIRVNPGETLINDVALHPKFYRGFVLEKRSDKSAPLPPEIKIVQRAATKYIVGISKAVAPFYLVFSENFSQDWQARVVNAAVVNEDKHLLANGYANSWYLEKTGDYQVEVSYRPEKWFKLLVLVSILSIAGSGLLVAFKLIRKPRKV